MPSPWGSNKSYYCQQFWNFGAAPIIHTTNHCQKLPLSTSGIKTPILALWALPSLYMNFFSKKKNTYISALDSMDMDSKAMVKFS
jgi:hypothetical protein